MSASGGDGLSPARGCVVGLGLALGIALSVWLLLGAPC